MRKKLSPDALDILAVSALGGWPMRSDDLEPTAELVIRGYVTARENALGVVLQPTTTGVRAAIAAGVIVQNGTRFVLADGFETKREREPEQSAPYRAPLRVVEPKAPDYFKEGMDAAIAGHDVLICPYDEGSSLERADWLAGHGAGLTVKKQGTV